MSHNHLITSDPGGRPVITGTHVTVEAMLKELAASEAVNAILATHPDVAQAYAEAWTFG